MASIGNDDLLCPITLNFLDDPVTLPCCGNTFSRIPLAKSLELHENRCPLCRNININFNPLNAPKNIIIERLVNSIKCGNTNNVKENDLSNITNNKKKFEEDILDFINKKISIDDLLSKFYLIDDSKKEKIIDDIIFSGIYNGMTEDDIMKIIDKFYNMYDNFTFNFEEKFNKFISVNVNNIDRFLFFANFLIKFCKKYSQQPSITPYHPDGNYKYQKNSSGIYCYGCDTIISYDKILRDKSETFCPDCKFIEIKTNYLRKSCRLNKYHIEKSNGLYPDQNTLQSMQIYIDNTCKLIKKYCEDKKTILLCKLVIIKTILGVSIATDIHKIIFGPTFFQQNSLYKIGNYDYSFGMNNGQFREIMNDLYKNIFSNMPKNSVLTFTHNSSVFADNIFIPEYIMYK